MVAKQMGEVTAVWYSGQWGSSSDYNETLGEWYKHDNPTNPFRCNIPMTSPYDDSVWEALGARRLRRLVKATLREDRVGTAVNSDFSVRSVMVLKRRTYISTSETEL